MLFLKSCFMCSPSPLKQLNYNPYTNKAKAITKIKCFGLFFFRTSTSFQLPLLQVILLST